MWVCGKCQFGQQIPMWLQNEEIIRFSLFSAIFWHKEMDKKSQSRLTLSTEPAQKLSTVTLSLFNSLKHVLPAPSQPSFNIFLSWLIRFEFRANICQSAWISGKVKNINEKKEKLIFASGASWACSSPAPRRPPASRTWSTTLEWNRSSRRRSVPAPRIKRVARCEWLD
jgi:hypothetical protein